MTVLGIDPGLTTGWALVGRNNDVYMTGIAAPEEIVTVLHAIRKGVEAVVIETFPLMASGTLAHDLRRVVSKIEAECASMGIEVAHVTPGVWKTSSVPASPFMRFGRRLTTHERDAIRMARWYIRRQDSGKDSGGR